MHCVKFSWYVNKVFNSKSSISIIYQLYRTPLFFFTSPFFSVSSLSFIYVESFPVLSLISPTQHS